MKHIGILRWNVLSRLYKNRSKVMCVLPFSLQGQDLYCFVLLQCKRQIIALYIFHLSGGGMPTQLRECHFTDNTIDILSCSHADTEIQTFFSICHLSTCDGLIFSPALQFAVLWWFLAILALTSTTMTQPPDPCCVWQGKRGKSTEPASAWSIFQPCQFFLGSRDKGNVLG